MKSPIALLTATLFISASVSRAVAPSSPGRTSTPTMSSAKMTDAVKPNTEDNNQLRNGGDPSSSTSGGSSSNSTLTSKDMVAFSSRLIAAARAMESRRQDRLFDDPFAETLAGNEAMMMIEEYRNERMEKYAKSLPSCATAGDDDGTSPQLSERRLAIRTRFCDDFFEDCALSKGIKQIVLVGAGMDTRGLRLKAGAGTKVFEVDQASVLRAKKELLSEAARMRVEGTRRAQVISVEADLSASGWEGELFKGGFDGEAPSAWIIEGLTMYLEQLELVELLRVVAGLCVPGSALCSTFVSAASVQRAASSDSSLMSTWKFGSDDPVSFVAAVFPEGWWFEGVTCGTPGSYPEGADYNVGFEGKAAPYVVGNFGETPPCGGEVNAKNHEL